MAGAFEAVRILDFTQGIAGPMACMNLADHGAEVIKVEPPGGDWMKDHPGYITWNRNKRRLVLDLHRYEGLHAARELLATADAAVFDDRPGELEALGLDAATVCPANPALLHTWLPTYGTEGRWSQLPPGDALLSAVAAVSFMQHSYADQPVHLVTPQASYGHAMLASAAIAAGLYEKSRSGRGQSLVVTGLHGVAAVMSGSVVSAGEVFRLGGGRGSRGSMPHYRLYQCGDGQWLFLATLFPHLFLLALEAMDLMDIIMMEGVDGELTNLQKPLVWPVVRPILEERFAEKPRAEWLAILKRAGVPCGPVGSRDAWFHGETVAANQMRIEMEHPKLGTVEMPGVPVKLAATPGSVRHLLQQGDQAAPWVSAREAADRPEIAASPATGGPLARVRVIDLGAVIAGAFSAGVLANLGADVIKVEPHQGDSFRSYGLGFAGYNRGKRSLVIDIKAQEGRELFYDLVRQCDAVVDNYRVGVRERLGIDHATLSAINPRIINCSISGYGTEGQLSTEPGFDPIMQAASGMMETQGGGEEPVYYQINVNDTASALMAAFGIVAALHARERTGRGQEVLTSLAAQSVLCQSGEVTAYPGSPPAPIGSLDCVGVSALQRLYPCADGEWLCLAGTRPEHFQQVCAALGHPEWAGRMTAESALREPRDGQLAENIAAALGGFDRDDALDRLLTRGVPAAPAIRLDQVWTDAWLKANRYLDEYEHPIHGTVTGVRTFGEWSRTHGGFERRAPLLGEHSTEVLREFGIDEGRIESLLAAGVVRQG